jgi:hypothetical protein
VEGGAASDCRHEALLVGTSVDPVPATCHTSHVENQAIKEGEEEEEHKKKSEKKKHVTNYRVGAAVLGPASTFVVLYAGA